MLLWGVVIPGGRIRVAPNCAGLQSPVERMSKLEEQMLQFELQMGQFSGAVSGSEGGHEPFNF